MVNPRVSCAEGQYFESQVGQILRFTGASISTQVAVLHWYYVAKMQTRYTLRRNTASIIKKKV